MQYGHAPAALVATPIAAAALLAARSVVPHQPVVVQRLLGVDHRALGYRLRILRIHWHHAHLRGWYRTRSASKTADNTEDQALTVVVVAPGITSRAVHGRHGHDRGSRPRNIDIEGTLWAVVDRHVRFQGELEVGWIAADEGGVGTKHSARWPSQRDF